MARIEDIPPGTREAVLALDCATPAGTPWVPGGPLRSRKVAIVTSAALHSRAERPFMPGSAEVRMLPSGLAAADIVMSHVSINYDRTGFSRDINIAYPVDRLRELAAEGAIGAAAGTHFSVMGSTDPASMAETAKSIAARCRAEDIDALLFSPV